jgi:uncharacterized protein (UPF0218 family)
MSVLYSLTPEIREKLKKPIGTLIRGSFEETMNRLKDFIVEEKPTSIISVGDRVSKNLVNNSIVPQLSIIDNAVMRKEIQPIPLTAEKTMHVKNPRGTISEEAFTIIQEALKETARVKIVVDGEEDLLTLVAVLAAPENSFVVYGQPHEGIVVVKASPEKKAEVAVLLKAMKIPRKTK